MTTILVSPGEYHLEGLDVTVQIPHKQFVQVDDIHLESPDVEVCVGTRFMVEADEITLKSSDVEVTTGVTVEVAADTSCRLESPPATVVNTVGVDVYTLAGEVSLSSPSISLEIPCTVHAKPSSWSIQSEVEPSISLQMRKARHYKKKPRPEVPSEDGSVVVKVT